MISLIIIDLEILAGKIREEKEIKEIQIEKKSPKFSVFSSQDNLRNVQNNDQN